MLIASRGFECARLDTSWVQDQEIHSGQMDSSSNPQHCHDNSWPQSLPKSHHHTHPQGRGDDAMSEDRVERWELDNLEARTSAYITTKSHTSCDLENKECNDRPEVFISEKER